MLKSLQTLCLFCMIVLNLLFGQTNARRVRIRATSGCEKESNWLGTWRRGPLQIDSDYNGSAYLYDVNSGNHQKWELIPDNGYYQLKNIATGLYLDSNHEGSIYTHPANGGDFQKWQIIHSNGNAYWLKNVATGRQLDCHRRKAYTWPPNDETSQRWYVRDA